MEKFENKRKCMYGWCNRMQCFLLMDVFTSELTVGLLNERKPDSDHVFAKSDQKIAILWVKFQKCGCTCVCWLITSALSNFKTTTKERKNALTWNLTCKRIFCMQLSKHNSWTIYPLSSIWDPEGLNIKQWLDSVHTKTYLYNE